ncbi:MAG: hypothetical protein HGA47_11780, partial [Zoogloea sp.]|nr:hypothetical protein [Zoogloea sp.]
GSLFGLVFPVCECGVVPLTRRLFRKGLPISAGIAFLLAAPVQAGQHPSPHVYFMQCRRVPGSYLPSPAGDSRPATTAATKLLTARRCTRTLSSNSSHRGVSIVYEWGVPCRRVCRQQLRAVPPDDRAGPEHSGAPARQPSLQEKSVAGLLDEHRGANGVFAKTPPPQAGRPNARTRNLKPYNP